VTSRLSARPPLLSCAFGGKIDGRNQRLQEVGENWLA
jgi:hypothetical protein